MEHSTPVDQVEPGRGERTVQSTGVLRGLLEGSVHVAEGAFFTVRQGGRLHGALFVASGGTAEIETWLQGSIFIERAASVTVTRSGHMQGSIYNAGRFSVFGALSGPIEGDGETYIDSAARLARPRREGNVTYWEFPN